MIQKKFIQPITPNEFKSKWDELIKKEFPNGYLFTEQTKFILNNFFYMLNNQPYKSINAETKQTQTNTTPKGFFIAGGVGSGKTTLLKLLFELAKNCGCSYSLECVPNADFSYSHISCKMQKIYYFPTTQKIYNERQIFDTYRQEGVLLNLNSCVIGIDDLFASSETICQYMGNKINLYDEYLQLKYNLNYTLTFATSNYPISEKHLKNKIDIRTLSRMKEIFAYYELTNKDLRQ